jgi:hypothetical protein
MRWHLRTCPSVRALTGNCYRFLCPAPDTKHRTDGSKSSYDRFGSQAGLRRPTLKGQTRSSLHQYYFVSFTNTYLILGRLFVPDRDEGIAEDDSLAENDERVGLHPLEQF